MSKNTGLRTNPFAQRVVAALDRITGRQHLHFLHIGKTGGTAIQSALGAAPAHATRILLHPHHVTLEQVPRGEPCFFFVRDPLARFVSGFYSRRRQGRPRYNVPWSPAEEMAFRFFTTANELAVALSSADESLRQPAVNGMRCIQHVRDSLWRWLVNEKYLISRRSDLLFVGSQERLEEDFASLGEIIGIRTKLPKDDLLAHRSPREIDRRLEEMAIRNLRLWYQREYACLDLLGTWFPHLPAYSRADFRGGN